MTADTDLRTSIRLAGPVSVLSPAMFDDLEAVLREALGNVVRHAGATAVSIEFTIADDVTLEITDNGIGLCHPLVGAAACRVDQPSRPLSLPKGQADRRGFATNMGAALPLAVQPAVSGWAPLGYGGVGRTVGPARVCRAGSNRVRDVRAR
ncbi:ATP-binding protein [Nocardia amikacinitolerans]|uniref:ATP-binding protein n=1 Tax=Nocardia amikacinitolerans TaxID=756689 RepID=UPI0036CB362B